MNRGTLWLFSWLACVLLTRPFFRVSTSHFPIAQLQAVSRAGFARGTVAWLGATGIALLMLRWPRLTVSELKRSISAGISIGILAAAVYTIDLFIEVTPSERALYASTLIANAVGTAFAGFAASLWLLGRELRKQGSTPNHRAEPASPSRSGSS